MLIFFFAESYIRLLIPLSFISYIFQNMNLLKSQHYTNHNTIASKYRRYNWPNAKISAHTIKEKKKHNKTKNK